MLNILRSLIGAARSFFRTQRSLALENLALRHQIGALKRNTPTWLSGSACQKLGPVGNRRLRIGPADRGLWATLSRVFRGWEHTLAIVQPATVVGWHRAGFKRFWTRKSRAGKPGRPLLDHAIRDLMRKMSRANPTWGSPRVRNELAKLGIEVSRATVAKYMIRHRKPPSPTWRTFLETTPMLPISLRSIEHGAHVKDLVSIDLFTVPTATFRVLFVLLVLSHDRRRVLHFNVTSSPRAEWTAQQIVQAFPEDATPRYLLRDRDGVYGAYFRHRVHNLGIEGVRTAPRSPWQSPYVERLVGSVRRECLDHLIVLNDQHLRRILRRYFAY